MPRAVLNYTAATIFFAAACRDWLFPGTFSICHYVVASGTEPVVWVVMGFVCIGAAMRKPAVNTGSKS